MRRRSRTTCAPSRTSRCCSSSSTASWWRSSRRRLTLFISVLARLCAGPAADPRPRPDPVGHHRRLDVPAGHAAGAALRDHAGARPAQHLDRADPALYGAEPAGLHADPGLVLRGHPARSRELRHDRRLHPRSARCSRSWCRCRRRASSRRASSPSSTPGTSSCSRSRSIPNPQLRTLPVGITLYQGEFAFPWPVISAALVVGIVPVAVLIVIFQERVVSGLTSGGIKG